jgi:hypothetical protein
MITLIVLTILALLALIYWELVNKIALDQQYERKEWIKNNPHLFHQHTEMNKK